MKKFYLQHKQKKTIKKRAKEANHFLKKTGILKNKKRPSLNTLPYYIVIGPQNAGKTTMLANSELKFILGKNFKSIDKIQNTKSYNWWATKHAIIIDTPGGNFSSLNGKTNHFQKYFFKLIKKYHQDSPPAGILLILDLDDLLRKSKTLKQNAFAYTREQLITLSKLFRFQIPIYLILNKCDLITGFREYFSDLSRDERQQAWGNLIQTRKINNRTFADNFSGIFNKMIRRLNDQLIWRLQHEHNHDKRALINEFPTKMLQLKKPLTQLLNNAFRKLGEKFCPAGIFFTAATQRKSTNLYQDADTLSSISRSLIKIQPPNNKAYFVHDLFSKHLFAEKIPAIKKTSIFSRSFLTQLFAYPALIILTCTVVFAGWYTFSSQIKVIKQAQQIIAADQLQNNENASLNSLYTLQKINIVLSKPITLFSLSLNKNNYALRNKIVTLYRKKLNSIMLPKITYLLRKNLQSQTLLPSKLYDGLKSYVMLGTADKYDKNYLESSLRGILTSSKKENQVALLYLDDFLKYYSPEIKLNKYLLAHARHQLWKLNTIDLAFVILSNNVPNNQALSLNLNDNKQAASIFTFANSNNNIQSMYTAQNFALIYPDLINRAAKEAVLGNWILGDTSNQKSKDVDINKITQQLSGKYLLNYANTWLQFISNIKTINFTKLDNLTNAVKLLGNDNSPLLELTKLIQTNIVPQVAKISPMLKDFATAANTILQQNSSDDITLALKNLYGYLQPITITNDKAKQTFKLTSTRMRNNGTEENDPVEHLLTISQSYPEPIKSWIYDLTLNTWHLMLITSEDYINSEWQKNIMPQYNAQIANHFPFSDSSSSEVDLTNFSYFFAPNGLIDSFFKDYLDAFVDSTQLPWKLKSLDGDSLPIYDTTLADLQKALQIQHIYFRRTDHSLYVPFTIQPLALNENTGTLTIALGSQQATYQNRQEYLMDQFIWPDNINSNVAKIIFTDQNSKQVALTEHGPWAWFKILQQQKMQLTKDKHYILTCNKNSLAAKLTLTTQQSDNPFSLKLFQEFKLPDDL